MTWKYTLSVEGLKSVGRLIRLPNVLMVILTQLLLRYCIIGPYVYDGDPALISSLTDFLILVVITLLLAIGGYVINDYFDVKIDSINRPDKMVVSKIITPRHAIKVHMILSGTAILLGFYLAYRIRAISFGFLFPFISGLLWIYSAKYKRVFFWGNFIVSVLSSFVILVVWLFEFFWLRAHPEIFSSVFHNLGWVSRVIAGYAVFAFLTTLVREIIKDMEDSEGDRRYECRTIPVVLGMSAAKLIVATLMVITMMLLAWAQFLLLRMELMMAFWYLAVTVQMPSVYFVFRLFTSHEKEDFSQLSTLCKLIMVAGILSMEILFISN